LLKQQVKLISMQVQSFGIWNLSGTKWKNMGHNVAAIVAGKCNGVVCWKFYHVAHMIYKKNVIELILIFWKNSKSIFGE